MTVSTVMTPTAKPVSLSKLGNGEYTAASVSADPKAAAALGLHKESDGNYGTTNQSPVVTSGSAATRSAPATQVALTSLVLGGK